MSLQTAFSTGKMALRRGGIAVATAAAVLAGSAQGATISERDCGIISTVSEKVLEDIGTAGLSKEFVDSFLGFVLPDGRRATCTGTRQIYTRTPEDSAIFSTFRRVLARPPYPIDLDAMGVRAVVVGRPVPTASSTGARPAVGQTTFQLNRN